jgi:energy-coupling factor transporter ATP-binding protein EcfA2
VISGSLEESRRETNLDTLLRVEDLRLYFSTTKGVLRAVDGVSFELGRNRAMVVLGESGCGKSTLGRGVLGLLPRGAQLDGEAIGPSPCTELSQGLVGLSGYPREYLGWAQYRALGAVALDLCEVARGGMDAFIDCSPSAHGPWDYLGGMLICQEAGAIVADAQGRDLVVLDHRARRTPLAAATPELAADVLAARQRLR